MRPLLCFALLFASSCGSTSTTYVGALDGTDVAVGLVTDGSHTALFFCGGAASYATATKWFRFAESSDSFTAQAGAWTAMGTTTGDAVSGTLDRGNGQTLTWSASRVPNDSLLGLYESIDGSGTSGVVVRSETNGAWTQGALITTQGAIEQIIPILPLEQTDHGLRVQVDGRETFVQRATVH